MLYLEHEKRVVPDRWCLMPKEGLEAALVDFPSEWALWAPWNGEMTLVPIDNTMNWYLKQSLMEAVYSLRRKLELPAGQRLDGTFVFTEQEANHLMNKSPGDFPVVERDDWNVEMRVLPMEAHEKEQEGSDDN